MKRTIEQLIEAFVREARLTEPKAATTYTERAKYEKDLKRCVDELARRDKLAALLPLLNGSETWVAYSAASQLAQFDETEATALSKLDRIADDAPDGTISGFAKRARNLVRFGDPSGAFHPPSEIERAFLRIVAQGISAAELQIETCLISEWDNGRLSVRVVDGPPLIADDVVLGPTVVTNRDGVVADAILWVNDKGLIVMVAVSLCGRETVPDPMSYFIEAARSDPASVRYRTVDA